MRLQRIEASFGRFESLVVCIHGDSLSPTPPKLMGNLYPNRFLVCPNGSRSAKSSCELQAYPRMRSDDVGFCHLAIYKHEAYVISVYEGSQNSMGNSSTVRRSIQ